MSRPIKIIIDARFTGYEVYEELNYPISYPSIGDCLDRYIPRFNEMIESDIKGYKANSEIKKGPHGAKMRHYPLKSKEIGE